MGVKRSGLIPAALMFPLVFCSMSLVARADDKPSVARGIELADHLCAGCHGRDQPRGISVEGVFVPSLRAIAARPHLTPGQLHDFLQIPHRPMPAIPLALADIKDLSAYIISLKE